MDISQAAIADPRRRLVVTLLVTAVVSVGVLTGGTAARAAPSNNVENAKQCLHGGWRTLKTSDSRSFRGVADCVIYALRGGQFAPPPGGGGGGE